MNLSREKKRIERLTKEGLQKLASNDYASAWLSFEQVLFLDEDNAVANTLGAASLLNLGRLEDAEPLARTGVRLAPQLALAHYYLSLILIAKQNYDEAESETWEAVAIEPLNAEARLLLGRLLFVRGREADALEPLARCVELSPRSAEAHFLLGLSLLRCGQIWRAKEELDKTLDLQPENEAALTFDGLLWMAKADHLLTTPPKLASYRHAVALLRRAIELNPENQATREWLRLAEETIERINKPSEPPLPPERWYKTRTKQMLVWLGLAAGVSAVFAVIALMDHSFGVEFFLTGTLIVLVVYLLSFGLMVYLQRGFSALPPSIVSFVEKVTERETSQRVARLES